MTCTVSPVSNEHPYPAAFRSGDLVAVSGRLGVTGTGALVPGGFAAECAQAFASLPYGGVVEVEALARLRDV